MTRVCDDCRGEGCEGCDGGGLMSSCRRCDDELPAVTGEMTGYLCAGCVLDIDRLDAAGERRELGRWMQ